MLTVYLVVNSGGKLSEVASMDMNTNAFLSKPAKQISECVRRATSCPCPPCFAGLDKKGFIFMSMEATCESFPPKLTTKYAVSKVLEKAASGEVRLGFRVPDLHRVAIKVICKRTIVTTFTGGDSSSNVLNKVWILQLVNHSYIISLEDVINTPISSSFCWSCRRAETCSTR